MGLFVIIIGVIILIAILLWVTIPSVKKRLMWIISTIIFLFIASISLLVWGFERGASQRYNEKLPLNMLEEIHGLDKANITISQPTVRNDTTFLLEEIGDTSFYFYHSIFIDTNKKSKFYDRISDFDFDEYDSVTYNASLGYFKEKSIKLNKKVVTGLPLKWIELYQYKDEFYVYKPSDFIGHYQVCITDTAFIDYTGEGPLASKIIDFRKIDTNTFKFKLTGAFYGDRTLIIHIIDEKRGIAVFETSFNEEDKNFSLMVSAQKIRNFPVIVNYCEDMKQMEFNFDEPDFEKLLRTKK